jgi:hypothetical protein
MVAARVSSSGICESMHQARNRCSRCRVRLRVAADAQCGHQGAQFFLADPRRQDLGGVVLGHDGVPHLREAGVRQTFPSAEQPAAVGPLRVDAAAAAIPQVPGDAAAHRGERVVGEFDQMEVVDQRSSRSAAARACGSPKRRRPRDRSRRTRCPRETAQCVWTATRRPRRRCGLRVARAGPDRRPSRRIRCPTGRPAPTARSPRIVPTWASRGGSRRCPEPGWVAPRPAPLRRGRRRRGARQGPLDATTRSMRTKSQLPL